MSPLIQTWIYWRCGCHAPVNREHLAGGVPGVIRSKPYRHRSYVRRLSETTCRVAGQRVAPCNSPEQMQSGSARAASQTDADACGHIVINGTETVEKVSNPQIRIN